MTSTVIDPLELVLERLEARGSRVQRTGQGAKAQCPAHDDQQPSLSVSRGDRQPVTLCCQAGCSFDAIVSALDLRVTDLCKSNAPSDRPSRIVATYPYVDGAGELLYEVVRRDPKDFCQRRPNGRGGHEWNLSGTRRVLYRLPEVLAAKAAGQPVYVVEGEKDADALARAGVVATCNPQGAGKWAKVPDAVEILSGTQVTIVADDDVAGWAHARDVARSLVRRAEGVVVKQAADGHNDVAEHLGAGRRLDELVVVAEARSPFGEPDWSELERWLDQQPSGIPDTEPAPAKRTSKATQLVDIALERYRLACDEEGRPFAVSNVDGGPNLARPVDRPNLGEELAALYFEAHGAAVGASPLADALATLRGLAGRADREPLALRVARHGDGIVVDLGTPDGRAVIVEPVGWRIVERSPVVFRRTALTQALPEPVAGGTLEGLRQLLNIGPGAWPVFVGWLVATLLLHDGSRPILFLTGEQGTAKTATARTIAQLLDPSPAPVRAAPRDVEQWVVSATASMVVALDNLSSMPDWLADALCRAATGEGLVRRQLYTDNEVAVNTFRRAVVLTTIDAGALRGDLGERLVPLELDIIPADRRRTDRDLAETFAAEHPRALGAVLDLTARVLQELPAVALDELPRMADFARVLAALDAAADDGALPAYLEALDDIARDVFESDPLAVAIRDLAFGLVGFHGSATDLLGRLRRPESAAGWPKTAKGLSGALRRLSPALRAMGVVVEWGKSNGSRWIRLGRQDPTQGRTDAWTHRSSVQCDDQGALSDAASAQSEVDHGSNASLAPLPDWEPF